MNNNELGITIAVVSILVALMTWLLGVVKNMRLESRYTQSSILLATPGILYGCAILIGFVTLFIVSYTVLPAWSREPLAYIGVALIVVEAAIILFAPFIVVGAANMDGERAHRRLFIGHGCGVGLLLLGTIIMQFFIDYLKNWYASLGSLSFLFALLGASVIMVGAYFEFRLITRR